MNLKKRYISVNDNELLSGVWDIYQKSFPPTEMRTLTNLKNILQGDHCRLVSYNDGDSVVGFILFWEYEHFIYIEFFATNPEMRNSGMGSYILRDFISEQTKTIILEIDQISNDISRRRCGFYQREGFILNSFTHTPPAYNNKNVNLDMHIMVYGREITQQEYDNFNKILIQEIMSNL